jgi:hypothetical protein
MVIRYLLVCVVGAMLAFGWGAATWGGGLWSWSMQSAKQPEALLSAVQASASESGAILYPGFPVVPQGATPAEATAVVDSVVAKYKQGPLFMVLYHKDGTDMSDGRVFVRGFLIELFATAALAAIIGLGGAGHGPLRRFMVLLAAVAFMCMGTHLVAWNFLYVPGSWTLALTLDSAGCWTLAGLPAVFFLRSMREGDVPKEFRAA